jgi:hypothetical protein
MSVATSIQIDKSGLDALWRAAERAQREFGKTVPDSLSWAAGKLCTSLAAATRVSDTLRPVVENPDPRAKTDGRFSKFGVYKFKPDRSQYFVPIYRTGEYGKSRYIDEKTLRTVTIVDGKRVFSYIETGTGEFQAPGIMQSKKRNIGRSGLAKRVWQWAAAHAFSGGVAVVDGMPDIAAVNLSAAGDTIELHIQNSLRYAAQAMAGGRQNVSGAAQRAADSLQHVMDGRIAKAYKNAGYTVGKP